MHLVGDLGQRGESPVQIRHSGVLGPTPSAHRAQVLVQTLPEHVRHSHTQQTLYCQDLINLMGSVFDRAEFARVLCLFVGV